MIPFEYLSVLISIILALGMTRVPASVGEMLQARSRRHVYWVHAIWIDCHQLPTFSYAGVN
jgi:hypothetical protein